MVYIHMSILELIKRTKGRFFRIVFYKRTNGERREMVARTGVHKDLTGEGLKFDPAKRNLKVVYDTGKRGYRMVDLESVCEFQCGKMVWKRA